MWSDRVWIVVAGYILSDRSHYNGISIRIMEVSLWFITMRVYCGGPQLPTKDTTIIGGKGEKGDSTQLMPFRPFNPRAGVNH